MTDAEINKLLSECFLRAKVAYELWMLDSGEFPKAMEELGDSVELITQLRTHARRKAVETPDT